MVGRRQAGASLLPSCCLFLQSLPHSISLLSSAARVGCVRCLSIMYCGTCCASLSLHALGELCCRGTFLPEVLSLGTR